MIQPAVPDPPEIEETLWRHFPPGLIGYDIGANCGQTIDRIHGFNSEQVIAFEPAEEAVEYLRSMMSTQRHWLNIVPTALSNHDGTVDLIAAPSKIETGQLVTHGTEGMEWSEEEVKDGVVRTVPAMTIDSFVANNPGCAPPSFMKIDVEGHELAVLQGAAHTLEEHRPAMLIEVHSQVLGEAIRLLLDPLYHLELVRHPHYAPGSDLFFTHFWYRCFPKA